MAKEVNVAPVVVEDVPLAKQKTAAQSRQEIAEVIAAASRAAAEAQKAAEEAARLEQEKAASKPSSVREARKETVEEREARREKRLLKLVGAVVVKCMSKHQKRMDHDAFKKHAKEVY